MPSTPNPLKDNSAKISALVRAGLLQSNELPQLKVALIRQQKVGDVAKLSKAHRDVIAKYNAGLSSAVLGSQQSFQAVRRNLMNSVELLDKEQISESINESIDPPMMLVLKRKGVRIFPDGQRVALYVHEKLGITFSVPYKQGQMPEVIPNVTAEELELDEAKVSFFDKINAHPLVKSYDGYNLKLKPLYWHKDTKQKEMRGTQQEIRNFLKNVEPDTRGKNMQKTAASLKLGKAHQSRISTSPIDLTKMKNEQAEIGNAGDVMESLEQVAAYAQQEQPKALAKHMKFADGSKLKVSHGAAKAIHMVHGALNDENKKKFADMLTTPKGFEKAAHFALSKVEYKIGGK